MTEISRRDFLKAVVPLGWIREAKASGLGNLSTPAKASLLKDVAIFVPGGVLLIQKGIEERERRRPFKEKVLSFGWDEASKEKALETFIQVLAEEYLRLTKTTRVNKADLTAKDKLKFYPQRSEFVNAIRAVQPDFLPTPRQFGYTHYATKKVFVDLGTLRDLTTQEARQKRVGENMAGLALIDALWHEWGHLDVEERSQGEYINNPNFFFRSPVSGKNEQFKSYRGGAVYTDTYYGFIRFEEVWNETVILRRMIQQVGLEEVFSTADYYENGLDFFPRLTIALGIPLDTLYNLHANSDFEGLAQLAGQKLSGNESALEKGVRLFVAIHQADTQMIHQTGALNLLPTGR